MDPNVLAIVVVIVAQVIGFSFWLGRLSQQVRGLARDVQRLESYISGRPPLTIQTPEGPS